MIIKSVKMRNFRKFKDILIDFPDGITGVVGLNGSGKSTIFESIAWALYGPIAARTSADQIKLENSQNSDPCRVELEFVFNDDNYRIVREMTGKSLTSSGSATLNGKLIVNGADALSRFIQKRLGMDFKSFYTSIFAKQKELNALSSMNPSERRPLILRMLGINELDNVISDIRSDLKIKKELIEKLELETIDGKGKSKIEILKNEKKEEKTRRNKLENLLKIIKEDVKIFEKDFKLFEEKIKENKNKYEKILKKKSELEEERFLFDKKKRLDEEIEELDKKIDQRKKSVDKQKLQLKKMDKLDDEIQKLKKTSIETDKNLQDLVKNIEKNNTIVKKIKEDISEIDSKKSKIEKLGPSAKCPTCDRILNEQYQNLREKYNNEILKRNENIKTILKQNEKLNCDFDKIKRQKQALEKKKDYIQNLIIEKEKNSATIKELQKEIKIEETLLKNKKVEVNKIKIVRFDEKNYLSIKKEVENEYESYQNHLKKLDIIRKKIQEKKIKLEKTQGEVNLLTEKIKNIEGKIKEIDKLKNKIKIENKQLYYIKMLNDLMGSFRTNLISRIRPTLSNYASEIFEQLTEGKYSELELDENYNIWVYDGGNAYGIERFSGGEEDLANLCIRLAISEVITEQAGSDFSFIVLDEIFGSQDIFRRQNIIKALNRFSSRFRQIFLITHIEDVKNYMENAIIVKESEEGISSIKIE